MVEKEKKSKSSVKKPRISAPLDRRAVRATNLERLTDAGFKAAPMLPLRDPSSRLRPVEEVAARAAALVALFFWVSAPVDRLPDADLRARIKRDALLEALTDGERAIVKLPRARARREKVDTIGWRLENIWSLAWVLGYAEEPSFDRTMIGDDTIGNMLEFLAGKLGVAALLGRVTPRASDDVVALEDLSYCAHNAARSAQLGSKTAAPRSFNPIAGCGVVHERRHALTWATSPGTAWDDTDLST
jgi:hypothetical protein